MGKHSYLQIFSQPKNGHKKWLKTRLYVTLKGGIIKKFKLLIHFYLTLAFYNQREELAIHTQICRPLYEHTHTRTRIHPLSTHNQRHTHALT